MITSQIASSLVVVVITFEPNSIIKEGKTLGGYNYVVKVQK